MKVTAETNSSTTTNYRRFYLEDGPIVGAGDSYIDGTEFQAELVTIKWIEGEIPESAVVRGRRIGEYGDLVNRSHERSFQISGSTPRLHAVPPEWLVELLK